MEPIQDSYISLRNRVIQEGKRRPGTEPKSFIYPPFVLKEYFFWGTIYVRIVEPNYTIVSFRKVSRDLL